MAHHERAEYVTDRIGFYLMGIPGMLVIVAWACRASADMVGLFGVMMAAGGLIWSISVLVAVFVLEVWPILKLIGEIVFRRAPPQSELSKSDKLP